MKKIMDYEQNRINQTIFFLQIQDRKADYRLMREILILCFYLSTFRVRRNGGTCHMSDLRLTLTLSAVSTWITRKYFSSNE